MRVRQAAESDIPAILTLEQESESAAHWSRRKYEELFLQGHEQLTHCAWVVEARDADKILGFLIGRAVSGEWELENVAVATSARRHGVASLLVSEMVRFVRAANGVSIVLEVRQSNLAARALYAKFGFAEAGVRRGYYSSPPEGAVLYCLVL